MARKLITLMIAGLFFVNAQTAAAQEAAKVVAVNYPLQFLAQRLLGEAGEVSFPVPAGVDPALWRPSIADISAIQSANLILLNGAGFATWVDRVSLPRSKLVNTTAASADQFIYTQSITHAHGDGGEHSHEGLASYTWLDPALAIAQAEAIADAIRTRDLAPADAVDAQLATLRSELDALDMQAAASLAALKDIPMIATHPRYQYFARKYGLSISALEWEAGAVPSPQDQADLEALVAKTGAKILIWEAAPSKEGLQIGTETGLANVIFPPLAHPVETQSFIETFSSSVSALVEGAKD